MRHYLREGKLPGERIGQQWFIKREALVKHQDKTDLYETRMKLLKEIQELRKQIYKETGRLFDGAAAVRRSRSERDKRFDRRMP